MARFKVGDKVRVKDNIAIDAYSNGCYFVDDMEQYYGDILTIKDIEHCGAYEFYSVNENHWSWADDWFKPYSEFTKADLKDGMVVEYGDGDKHVVCGGQLIGVTTHLDISKIGDDLKYRGTYAPAEDLDIVKVYKARKPLCFNHYFTDCNLELIWERKPEETHKEMTVEEIEKELGYKIKIIADKE